MSTHILVVAGHAPSLLSFRRPLIEAMVARGLRVSVAAPGLEDKDLNDRVSALGVEPHAISLSRAGINPLSDLKSFVALFRLMRRLKPDYLLAYTIKPVVYGLIAGARAGVSRRFALITGLGYAFTGEARGKRAWVQKLVRTLYRHALSHADGVIFQNPDDAADFAKLNLTLGRKVFVVSGSGVDLAEYPPAPFPSPEAPITFLLIARLLTTKGIREYAEAARGRREAGSQARFLLVGPQDRNPDAIPPTEVSRWVNSGVLEWRGGTDDVRPYLAACHVYVLPSYREGTPRSTLEALATGRAVITTEAPGCRETVVDGINGFLVPPRDATALTAAMRRFEDDHHLITTMGAASLDLARKRYDVQRVNQDMMRAMDLS